MSNIVYTYIRLQNMGNSNRQEAHDLLRKVDLTVMHHVIFFVTL
jgi:hypothetical protein